MSSAAQEHADRNLAPAKQWQQLCCRRRADRDVICSAVGLTVHMAHFATFSRTLPLPTLLPLLALGAANLLSILASCFCRPWYLRYRTVINTALRLGIISLPAAVLHAAYRADQPVTPDVGAAALAWRVLLTSRAFILLLPAMARRLSLLPQVGLSLLAAGLAAGNADAACATPLMQHSRVQSLLGTLGQGASAALALLLPSAPLPPPLAGSAAVSCRRAVAFLQLALGVVAPTALYLWEEAAAAEPFARGASQAGWELRLFLRLGRKRRNDGVLPFLSGTVVALLASWVLTGAM